MLEMAMMKSMIITKKREGAISEMENYEYCGWKLRYRNMFH
jgi:hypothetical protein